MSGKPVFFLPCLVRYVIDLTLYRIAVPSQGLIKQWRAELKAFSPTLRSLEFSPLLDVSKLRATDVVVSCKYTET